MNKKDKKKEVKRLQNNRQVIKDRIDLLEEVQAEMNGTGHMPSVPLGGLFDDIIKLNPFRAETLIPALLQEYRKELGEVDALVTNMN